MPATDTNSPPATDARDQPLGMAPLAGLVFVMLVLCGLAQPCFGPSASWGAKALGVVCLAAAGTVAVATFALRPRTLASMGLAVVVLTSFAAACVLATLTVQERDFRGASEQELWDAFRRAESGLFCRLLHPLAGRGPVALDTDAEAGCAALAKAFGARHAEAERKGLIAALRAQSTRQAAAQWAEDHDRFLRGLYRVMRTTRLSNAFSAWWFGAILVLLVLNLTACTIARLRPSLRAIGFAATHGGVLLALLGAFVGTKAIHTGTLALEVGGPDRTSKFVDERSGEVVSLGFTAKLEAFQTVYHKQLFVAVPRGEGSEPFTKFFRIEPGKEHRILEGTVAFCVQEVMPSAIAQTRVEEDAKAPLNPAAHIALARAKDDIQQQWLYSESAHTFVHPSNQIKIRYAAGISQGQARHLAHQTANPSLGIVTVRDRATGASAKIEARPNETAKVGPYTVTVRECYGDFAARDRLPLEQQYPRQPAVALHVAKDGDAEARWVFKNFDYDAMHRPKFHDLTFGLAPDLWRSACGQWFLLVRGADGLTVHAVKGGVLGPGLAVALGKITKLEGARAGLMVTKVLGRAREHTEVAPYRAPADADPLTDPSEPAIRLRVQTPAGSQERWLLANTEQGLWELPEGATLVFVSNTDTKPRAWSARLGFYEEGEKRHSQVARVNHPARYRGCTFYQWDAKADRPGYAGIRVVRDPSWVFVKTGLTFVLLGVAFMFYVQPFLRRSSPSGDATR